MKTIWQSLILIFSFVLVYVWQQTSFAPYTIPALGFLIFLYLLLAAKKRREQKQPFFDTAGDVFILNTAILLLIFSTGDINSPLFFLLYFLGFGIAFVFEPATIFIFVLGCIAVFLPIIIQGDILDNSIRMGALCLISPLAFFFSREYKARSKQEAEIGKTTAEIKKDADDVLQEDPLLDTEAANKLKEIKADAENLQKETE